jgi:hypothetical protein
MAGSSSKREDLERSKFGVAAATGESSVGEVPKRDIVVEAIRQIRTENQGAYVRLRLSSMRPPRYVRSSTIIPQRWDARDADVSGFVMPQPRKTKQQETRSMGQTGLRTHVQRRQVMKRMRSINDAEKSMVGGEAFVDVVMLRGVARGCEMAIFSGVGRW